MDTIIIGGSFNPLHIGHLYLAEEAYVQFRCRSVYLVPSNISAHKTDKTAIEPDIRLEMVRRVIEDIPWLHLEDCEIKRGGVSYSIDTVKEMKEKYELNEKPGLVVGDDLIKDFHMWKDYASLLEEVQLIVAHRRYKREIEVPYPHCYLDNTVIPISSSTIREHIKKGLAFRFLIPERVYTFIQTNNLYSS